MCVKCLLPDGYTRSSIRIRKINVGAFQSWMGHIPDFLQCRVNIFTPMAFRSSTFSLVEKMPERNVGEWIPCSLCPEVPTSPFRGMWRCRENLRITWDQSQEGSEDTEFATRGNWPEPEIGPSMIVQTSRDLPSLLETPETDQPQPYCCRCQKSPEGCLVDLRLPSTAVRAPTVFCTHVMSCGREQQSWYGV